MTDREPWWAVFFVVPLMAIAGAICRAAMEWQVPWEADEDKAGPR